MTETGAQTRTVVQSPHRRAEIDRVPDWPSWSVEEAAEATGYNAEYIRRLCRRELVVHQRIGRTILIKQDSLRAYIAQHEDDDARYGPRRPGRK